MFGFTKRPLKCLQPAPLTMLSGSVAAAASGSEREPHIHSVNSVHEVLRKMPARAISNSQPLSPHPCCFQSTESSKKITEGRGSRPLDPRSVTHVSSHRMLTQCFAMRANRQGQVRRKTGLLFRCHSLYDITTWMRNYIPWFSWDMITHPYYTTMVVVYRP